MLKFNINVALLRTENCNLGPSCGWATQPLRQLTIVIAPLGWLLFRAQFGKLSRRKKACSNIFILLFVFVQRICVCGKKYVCFYLLTYLIIQSARNDIISFYQMYNSSVKRGDLNVFTVVGARLIFLGNFRPFRTSRNASETISNSFSVVKNMEERRKNFYEPHLWSTRITLYVHKNKSFYLQYTCITIPILFI
jgi:hypothetical protein